MTDEKDKTKKRNNKHSNKQTRHQLSWLLQFNWIATKMSVDYPPAVCVRNKSINWHWFCFKHQNSLHQIVRIWYVVRIFSSFILLSLLKYIFFFCAQHISFRNTIPESIRPNSLAMYFPMWCFDTVDKTSLNWWFILHGYNNMLKISIKINKFWYFFCVWWPFFWIYNTLCFENRESGEWA